MSDTEKEVAVADFDPYSAWLGIQGLQQPPDHYALLGLARYETDLEAIRRAADARTAAVRSVRPGPHVVPWQQLLDAIAAARACLLTPADKEAYDRQLSQRAAGDQPQAEGRGENVIWAADGSLSAAPDLSRPEPRQAEIRRGGLKPAANPLPPPLRQPGQEGEDLVAEPPETAPVESWTKNLLPPSLGAPEPSPPTQRVESPLAPGATVASQGQPADIGPAFSWPAPADEPQVHATASLPLDQLLPPMVGPAPAASAAANGLELPVAAPVATPAAPVAAPVATPVTPAATTAMPLQTPTGLPAATDPRGPSAAEVPLAPAAMRENGTVPVVDPQVTVVPSPAVAETAPAPGRSSSGRGTLVLLLISLGALAYAAYLVVGPRGKESESDPLLGQRPPVVERPAAAAGPEEAERDGAAEGQQPKGEERTTTGGEAQESTPQDDGQDLQLAPPVSDEVVEDDSADEGAEPEVLANEPEMLEAREPEVSLAPEEPLEDWTPGADVRPPADERPIPADELDEIPALSIPELTPGFPEAKPSDPGVPPNVPGVKPSVPEVPPTVPAPDPVPAQPPAPVVPQLSESQLTELAAALSEVPRLLGQRKLAEAKQSLQRAQALERQGAEGPHSARVRRMELLCDYVEQFWDAVRQGMPGVEGEDLHFGEMVIHVSVANERGIRYRDRGRNVTWRFYEMPAQLARAIAEKWLDDRPTSQIFLGAFMAVDPKYGVEKARQRWQRARQGGAPVDELMPILDEL